MAATLLFLLLLGLGLEPGEGEGRRDPYYGRPDDPKFEMSYNWTRRDLGRYFLTPNTPKIPLGFETEGVEHPDASILTKYPPFNEKTEEEEALFLKWIGSRAFSPAVIEVPLFVSIFKNSNCNSWDKARSVQSNRGPCFCTCRPFSSPPLKGRRLFELP